MSEAVIRRGFGRNHDTAPGEDGLQFSAWKASSKIASNLLLRCFDRMCESVCAPAGFNYTVHLGRPKKVTQDFRNGVAVPASAVRAIGKKNTDNKNLT
eukprot:9622083-Karenia_brevis.AAC.1